MSARNLLAGPGTGKTRTVLVAAQLGQPLKTFSNQQLQDLLAIKKTLDIPDRRHDLKECELCDNNEWRPGVSCQLPVEHAHPAPEGDPEAERLVQSVTDMIMKQMKA
jgi:L-fuculose-phosphate aldolase